VQVGELGWGGQSPNMAAAASSGAGWGRGWQGWTMGAKQKQELPWGWDAEIPELQGCSHKQDWGAQMGAIPSPEDPRKNSGED